MTTATTTSQTKCPGCGHQQAPTDRCLRCGWRLDLKLWQAWLTRQRQKPSRRRLAARRMGGG